MFTRAVLAVVAAALALTAAACGSNTPKERVFFVEPKDGATVKPDLTLKFGSEMFTIAAVPEGEVKEVRSNTGHYHVAPDADCLPANTVIPKADPWVHFGKGTDTAEISLSPGPHKLTLQAGDDQHRTIEGLCETINVTVAE
jgi:Domain of unknown function (DUF4399)